MFLCVDLEPARTIVKLKNAFVAFVGSVFGVFERWSRKKASMEMGWDRGEQTLSEMKVAFSPSTSFTIFSESKLRNKRLKLA